MAIKNGLYQLLTQDAGVSALLGQPTGVFFSLAPTGSVVPYVVMHLITAVPLVDLEATADLLPYRFQFDAYGSTDLQASGLATAAFNLLKDFAGNLPGSPPDTNVEGCVANNMFDMPYEIGDKNKIFRSIVDVTLWAKPLS